MNHDTTKLDIPALPRAKREAFIGKHVNPSDTALSLPYREITVVPGSAREALAGLLARSWK